MPLCKDCRVLFFYYGARSNIKVVARMESIYVAILSEYQENLSYSDRRGLPDKCVTQPDRMAIFNTSGTSGKISKWD